MNLVLLIIVIASAIIISLILSCIFIPLSITVFKGWNELKKIVYDDEKTTEKEKEKEEQE